MTRTSIRAAAVVLSLGLVACVGTLEPVGGGGGDDSSAGPDGGGGSGAARQMFDSTVMPVLGQCAGCHTGTPGTAPLKFLGNSGTTGYYAALIAQPSVTGNFIPANAQILLQGVHDNNLAPAFTQPQKDAITAWLNAEAAER